MRYLVIATLAASCLLVGCLPKHTGVKAASTLDVAVVVAAEYADRPEVTGVPDPLVEALRTTLEDRNLTPRMLNDTVFTEPFAAKRNALHRLTWLSDEESSADLVLLIEARPRFFSLLSGQYRWTVELTMTLVPPGRLEEAVTTEVKFPIFMEFHHETEEEVLQASIPLFERHLGFLLDEYLGGTGG